MGIQIASKRFENTCCYLYFCFQFLLVFFFFLRSAHQPSEVSVPGGSSLELKSDSFVKKKDLLTII